MRKFSKVSAILLSLTLLLSVATSVAAEAATANLLTNPGFENGLEGWTVKRGISTVTWDALSDLTSTHGGVFTYGETDALPVPTDLGDGFGTKYLQLTKSSARSLILQRITGLRAGGTYLFSGWTNCEHNDSINIICSFYSGDTLLNTLTRDANGYGTDISVAVKPTAGEWIKVQTTIALPVGADGVEIGIQSTTRDETLAARRYDNFSLTEKTNMLSNGDFENVTFSGAEGTAADWFLKPNNVTESFSSDSHSGSSAFWVGDGQNDTYIQQFVPATGGLQYKLSFWMKVASTATKNLKAKAFLYFYDKAPVSSTEYAGTSVGTIEVRGTLQAPTDGWRETVLYFTAPASAKGIGVQIYSSGLSSGESPNKGLVMFDDVVLTTTSENVALLGISNSKPATVTRYTSDAVYQENVPTWVDDLQKTVNVSPAESLVGGSTYYAAAMTQNAAEAIVVFALYKKAENNVYIIEEMKIVNGTKAMAVVSTEGITVPADGEYVLKAYVWDAAGGMKPIEKVTIQ